MGLEREIRFLVTDGRPAAPGRSIVQIYLWRRPALRVRLVDDREARLNLKVARGLADREWELPVPAFVARMLARLPLPRVEKTRCVEGRLEIDCYQWPRELVVVECELGADETLDLDDPAARSRWMEARRPAWVGAWRDVSEERTLRAASLAATRRVHS